MFSHESWIYEIWIFSRKFVVCFDLFKMDFHLIIKIDYKLPIHLLFQLKRQFFLSKNQLQVKNSGFVKTCDEHVPRCNCRNSGPTRQEYKYSTLVLWSINCAIMMNFLDQFNGEFNIYINSIFPFKIIDFPSLVCSIPTTQIRQDNNRYLNNLIR